VKDRILIAEDNPETHGLLQVLLRDEPYRADFATTGMEALSYYHHANRDCDPYRLLILDIAMPLKTGLTVAREVRAAGDWDTEIVFLTAVDQSEAAEAAREVAAAVWQKPFGPIEFCRGLHELLD
jgi:CheY-like chemotaxis protein